MRNRRKTGKGKSEDGERNLERQSDWDFIWNGSPHRLFIVVLVVLSYFISHLKQRFIL